VSGQTGVRERGDILVSMHRRNDKKSKSHPLTRSPLLEPKSRCGTVTCWGRIQPTHNILWYQCHNKRFHRMSRLEAEGTRVRTLYKGDLCRRQSRTTIPAQLKIANEKFQMIKTLGICRGCDPFIALVSTTSTMQYTTTAASGICQFNEVHRVHR
jgi:hypothetical protein